jgi:hypothetical protein
MDAGVARLAKLQPLAARHLDQLHSASLDRLDDRAQRYRRTWNGRWRLIQLGIDANALAEDASRRNPAVDKASVVSDLEARSLDGLHDVQVLVPTLQSTMSPTMRLVGSTGSTVTSCPDSMRPVIEPPRGRNWMVSPR